MSLLVTQHNVVTYVASAQEPCNITTKKAPYHHQGPPKAVDASIPKPMLLGSNKLPGKLHIVGCVLLNARAFAISVVRRHGSHPKMNRHVVAL